VDLLTVGESFEDVIFSRMPRLPRLGEELRVDALSRHPGGGAIITAVAAARLGLRTGVLSGVSPINEARLQQEGVTLTNVRRADERGAVSVALSTTRDRAFVTFDGVNRVIEPRLIAQLRDVPASARHVHFALVPRRCRAWLPVLRILRRHGVSTSWDFGWSATLRQDSGFPTLLAAVDWIFVNDREAAHYARTTTLHSAAQRWRGLARQTVIKLGARGAIAVIGDTVIRRRGIRVAVVDTTGAGDAFNAGFLAASLAKRSVDAALRLGNHVGGQSTRRAGGIDGLPERRGLPVWAARLLEPA
jgi:sugar/nucleoside kinase (ribokinase family)